MTIIKVIPCSLLLWSGILLIMGGCTPYMNTSPSLQKTDIIEPEKGLVVARVINTSSYPVPFNYLTLSPENYNESNTIQLERIIMPKNSALDNTSVFFAAVPEGSYTASDIDAYYSGDSKYYSKFIDIKLETGTFQVSPGQVTDLGTIAYYRKVDEDSYFNEVLRIPDTGRGEVLDKHFTFYKYNKENLKTWDEDGLDPERENAYLSAVQNPNVYDAPFTDKDGALYFPARLGVLLKRDILGEWSMQAIDTNLNLDKHAIGPNEELIIGGSEGEIFISHDGRGDSWQDISLPSADHIQEIFSTEDGFIDVLAIGTWELRLYRGKFHQSDINWQIIDRYDTSRGWHSIPLAKPLTPEQENTRKLARKRLINAEFTRFDKDSAAGVLTIVRINKGYSPYFYDGHQKKFVVTPGDWGFRLFDRWKDPQAQELITAGNVELKIKKPGLLSWDGITSYERFDQEQKEWVKLATHLYKCDGEYTDKKTCVGGNGIETTSLEKPFSFQSLPWFKNDKEAFALANFSNTNFWTSVTKYESKVLKTADGGQTWTLFDQDLPGKFCSYLVSAISDTLLLGCNGVSGDFYESSDMGETWQHVRQHESF